MKETIKGNIVDILARKICEGEITVADGKIYSVEKKNDHAAKDLPYLLPGFIDAHVHIESSMLVPSEFARLAVTHGTVATISDPHEIANVCGIPGIEYMIKNGNSVPFKFHFGAPSCVPATTFETAGAEINAKAVGHLLERKDIFYLSEMMNFPGVLHGDKEVLKKIEFAKKFDKPVDGHAPGLMGEDAARYIKAGISTDHECFTREEALNKLKYGMKILIREGSAAKNFDALIGLLNDFENEMMFCSDDKHPDSLAEGHINLLCQRAVKKGIDIFKILKAACLNPISHYRMHVGQLRPGDAADFIICEDLINFRVKATFINGIRVSKDGKSLIDPPRPEIINHFDCGMKHPKDFRIRSQSGEVRVIHAIDGQLITESSAEKLETTHGMVQTDPEKDILKIVVVNRYMAESKPAVAFIKNFGLKKGAIASSVAHDSHNIIAVGIDDESICTAVNMIIEKKGGISFADSKNSSLDKVLALPVAGLMSNENGYDIAEAYTNIDHTAKMAGSSLSSPFMTLSFMALLVIPKLKLSDRGLFDGEQFKLID